MIMKGGDLPRLQSWTFSMLKRLYLDWLSDSVNHFDHYMPVCVYKKQ